MVTIAQTLAQAIRFHQAGNLAQAEALYRQILQANPAEANGLHLLGMLLKARGQPQAALDLVQRASTLLPQVAEIHCNLADLYLGLGRWPEALASSTRAVSLRPDLAAGHVHRGDALAGQEKWPEAAAAYQQGLALQPDDPLVHWKLGRVLAELGQIDQAIAAYRQAIGLQPDFAEAHANLAELLLEENQSEEAAACYRAALASDPACISALAQVATHGLFPLSADQVQCMRALVSSGQLVPADLSRLHFALGTVADRAAAYDEAFAHFRQANAFRRRVCEQMHTAYDAARHRAWSARVSATCNASYFERLRGFGRDSERPVFIVGMPRSGTSLIEQILASHPEAFGAGELWDITGMALALPERLGGGQEYPECLGRLDKRTATALADEYLGHSEQLAPRARRVLDKQPTNFEHLGLIAALFPRARIIHCRRDPLDTCLSCYMHQFGGANFTYDLHDLGGFFRDYERLMAHWRAVLPLPMLDVAYEELVADLEGGSRRLVEFCALAWDARCLAFYQNRRPVRTASVQQVRQPIYLSSIGRWRRYAAHLGSLAEELGVSLPLASRSQEER